MVITYSVAVQYTYHITTTGKNISTLDALLRPGDWLMETLYAFQTFDRLIWAVVVWRTRSAEHLLNTETWCTRDELFHIHSAVVRFKMRVN